MIHSSRPQPSLSFFLSLFLSFSLSFPPTRCVCANPACNTASRDPCGVSVDPPKFPPAFTTQMVIREFRCQEEGCHTFYDVRARSVNATEGKFREDRIADDLESSFILKSSGEGYDEVSV